MKRTYAGEYTPPSLRFVFFFHTSRLVTVFTTKPFGCEVSPAEGPVTHPFSGLKQHYHQGKPKTFDQLAVKHSPGKKKKKETATSSVGTD